MSFPDKVTGAASSKTRLMLAYDEIAFFHHDATVQWVFGRLKREEHGKRRRVSLVPTVGKFTISDQGGVALRLLDTAILQVTDEDYGKCEQLFLEVLRAAFSSPLANIKQEDQDGEFSWVTEREGEAGILVRGPVLECYLRFRVDIPIDDDAGAFTLAATQTRCQWIPDINVLPDFPDYVPPP
ncbi:MAG: hypothetical protein R3337_00405 [Gammaproteobacteria bacterium]|nr:hypothetical protein [Gammaproteobacteria bacterium]